MFSLQGTRLIRLFQISDETGVEYLSTFTRFVVERQYSPGKSRLDCVGDLLFCSGGDVTGMAFRPKNACDIKNAEIASGVRMKMPRYIALLAGLTGRFASRCF